MLENSFLPDLDGSGNILAVLRDSSLEACANYFCTSSGEVVIE